MEIDRAKGAKYGIIFTFDLERSELCCGVFLAIAISKSTKDARGEIHVGDSTLIYVILVELRYMICKHP